MRTGAMECGQLTPQSIRQVTISRQPGTGFGFVAGSVEPVVVRSVIAGGPSENKLLSGDQILAINDEDVSKATREKFIELVRNANDSITLTVLQPHQSPKSAFISAAKKAKLRSKPGRVRFSELVTVGDPEADMLKMKDSLPLLLIPNVLKVFLENGQIKSFTFDGRTTVKDVMVTLQDRISLRHRDHFSLVLQYSAADQSQKFLLLQDKQPLAHVVHRTHYQGMKCLFRVCFFPKDPADILHSDPAAFEYLYIQSRNDLIRERLGSELKPEVLLGLCALHIYISVSSSHPGQKISLRGVEKEWGLEPFLPPSLLQSYKEKSLRKALAQHLKVHQNQLSASKASIIQAKLRYLRILNELPTFAGVLFNTVAVDEKTPAATFLVGPRHGISHVIDLKTNLTTVLFEFSQVTKVQLFRESQGVARVETTVTDTKSLVLLMDWPEATSFACLVAGYYRLLVDSKKGNIYRTTGHLPPPQMIKADHISLPTVSRLSASGKAQASSNVFTDISTTKCSTTEPHTFSENPESISLCYLHLRDKEGRDINQNVVTEEARPRTKSDPTPKVLNNQAGTEVATDPSEVCRTRSFTMDSQVKQESGQFYCDSCKAKMKSRSGGGGMDMKCINSCGSSTCRDNSVDLISLPPPENRKEKEEDDGRYKGECLADDKDLGETTIFLPSAAPPPPGFEDNSSDEEGPKRGIEKDQEKAREGKKVIGTPAFGYDELPVTLIDNVQTRTVRDHARELDDALVSTLQALEALAASEDFPSTTPQSTAGLIVLATITPESSLDSGHETNSSELTDLSDMVTAMKQHHNTAYFLAHHLSKESLLSRKDLPFRIQTCAAQAVVSSPLLGKETPLLKPSLLQQSLSGVNLQQEYVSSSSQLNSKNEKSVCISPEKCKEGASSATLQETNISKDSSNAVANLTEDSSEPILSPSDSTIRSTSQKDMASENGKKSLDACGCPLSQGESSLFVLDESRNDVLHLSPTDDERLHAKACSAMNHEEEHLNHEMLDKKEVRNSCVDDVASQTFCKRKPITDTGRVVKPEQIPPVQNIFSRTTNGERETVKADTEKVIASSFSEKVPTLNDQDECDGPAKPKNRVPNKLRKLFSATFPTRMRRETDERQAQLRKVKQYEMEFLEELLRPQGKIGTQGQETLYPLVPGHCSCQVRSSPLQKVPGMSREQRRSCDCKRIIRGIRVPPNTALEIESRTRPEVVRATSRAGNRLKRSSSLESRGSEKVNVCITSRATHGENMAQYTNLLQKYDHNEEKKELPFTTPAKSQKKETEPPVIKKKVPETSGNSEERETLVNVPRQDEVFSVMSKMPEEVISEEKCCSIRHCFNCRRCSSADDSSDRDELSYSIPMQILPGLRLNSETTTVLSQTLKVLDASVCSDHEDNQTQEIDLRTATFEGSLAKVNALRGHTYALPDGFTSVQLDTSELLTVLRQCLVSTEAGEPKVDSMRLSQHKQELTMRFKEFRASCRRMAGVDKNPEHMLTAVTCSFQVLCSLIETFVKLLFLIHSESQRQELLAKVEEVVRNYTFLLRAAEESSTRSVGQSHTVVGQLAKQSATVATAVSTFSRSIKTLMSK
ncbi:FERM and PDZ domain-containing protein 3 [Gastrophryne carolinensis]